MRGRVALAGWVLGAVGCAPVALEPVDDDGCPLPATCDIRDAACQARVFEIVTCNRAADVQDMPEIQVLDYDTWVQAHVDDPWIDDEVTWRLENRGHALFGLAPPDAEPADVAGDYASAIAAVYSAREDLVTILDRGQPMDSDNILGTLAHEFTHAQQHAEIDLIAYRDVPNPTLDLNLTLRAMTEGEAELYENLLEVRLAGNHPYAVDWFSWYKDNQARARQWMMDVDFAPTMAYLAFPYPFGVEVALDSWIGGGPDGVRELRDNPMVSTRQVMEGLWSDGPGLGAWLEDLAPVAVPVLPAAYVLVSIDSHGAFLTEATGARLGCEPLPVLGLGGDTFSIFHDAGADNVVAAARLRFATVADREAWRACLDTTPGLRTGEDGGDLVVLASEDPQVLDDLGDVLWGPAGRARLAPGRAPRLHGTLATERTEGS